MIQDIKNAFAELEHVVWPTKRETQSYFKIVVTFIVVTTFVLFVVGYVFGELIFGAKSILIGGSGTNTELLNIPTNIEISDLDTPDAESEPIEPVDDNTTVEVEAGTDGESTKIDITSDS